MRRMMRILILTTETMLLIRFISSLEESKRPHQPKLLAPTVCAALLAYAIVYPEPNIKTPMPM